MQPRLELAVACAFVRCKSAPLGIYHCRIRQVGGGPKVCIRCTRETHVDKTLVVPGVALPMRRGRLVPGARARSVDLWDDMAFSFFFPFFFLLSTILIFSSPTLTYL